MEKRCSDDKFWVVIDEKGADIHPTPSWMVRANGTVSYATLLVCLERQGAWMKVSDKDSKLLGWVMWKHVKTREWHLKVKPLSLIALESQFVDVAEDLLKPLPGEALDWQLNEIDMFLATCGQTGPSRETARARSGKTLSR